MALWQIDFFILPATYSELEINSKYVDDSFDDSFFWQKFNFNRTVFNPISDFMALGKSWADSIVLYGDENSNRLNVIIENDVVVAVSFRIDFTSDYENILESIIKFCSFHGFSILDNNLNVLLLNFEAINSVIINSPQVAKYNILSGKQ